MICCSHFAVVLKQIHKSLVLEIWYSRTRFFTTLHISDDCHERSVITCFQQHQPKLISKLLAAVTVTCMVLWYWSTIVSPKISTIQDLTETTWIKGKYVLEYVCHKQWFSEMICTCEQQCWDNEGWMLIIAKQTGLI